jgi:hypothetical protein
LERCALERLLYELVFHGILLSGIIEIACVPNWRELCPMSEEIRLNLADNLHWRRHEDRA